MFHMAKIRFICHLLNPQENKLSLYYIAQICNKSISKWFFNKFIFRNYTTKILLYICAVSK